MSAADDRLRELALQATPGPWHEVGGTVAYETGRCNCGTQGGPDGHEGGCGLDMLCELDAQPNPDAAYIAAASPDVMLGLLDERDRLARWKAEALPVLDGLQEIGKALDLPPGARITGPQALEAIEVILAERDDLRERVAAHCEERDAALPNRRNNTGVPSYARPGDGPTTLTEPGSPKAGRWPGGFH